MGVFLACQVLKFQGTSAALLQTVDPTLYITEPIKIHAMEWNWTTGRNALTAMRGGEIHALERHRNELVVQFQKRCLPPLTLKIGAISASFKAAVRRKSRLIVNLA